jgi:hypothetical protein
MHNSGIPILSLAAGWAQFFPRFCSPLGKIHVNPMQSLAAGFTHYGRLRLSIKHDSRDKRFDWQGNHETICILSFMVCFMHGDQLSTAPVLLYATTDNLSPWRICRQDNLPARPPRWMPHEDLVTTCNRHLSLMTLRCSNLAASSVSCLHFAVVQARAK